MLQSDSEDEMSGEELPASVADEEESDGELDEDEEMGSDEEEDDEPGSDPEEDEIWKVSELCHTQGTSTDST
jgi:hypothetical protein